MKKTLLNRQIFQILFFSLFFSFSFSSCHKEEININLNEKSIKVIGHGGMGIGQVYPMNTYESIAYALSLGSDGVEIDVQMTKDGVLVAFHDEELETKTNKKGKIYEQNWDDIKDAQYIKSAPYTNYRIVRLEDLFAYLPNLDKYVISLDVKSFNPSTSAEYNYQFNTALISLIEKYKQKRNLDLNNIFLELKRTDLIESIQKERPNYQIFTYETFEIALERAKKYNLRGIIVQTDYLTKEKVELAHNEGLLVATFNTHSETDNIEAINKGVDYIQTDKVQNLIKILK
ncbi:glycerophosphoryl diester phosphodiesterase [Bernardetia litoralis DSM 6794]|uniref:Glycerophosphoryl diester phosphodiesterase n=1 Tax=Bernardetia litoralis (strain ATCC 23117 / DSM 6794 / NBRC 15988 / NCIMB 1366 / Fx l1 / Sio-4) TaxID=880071 RepID=I4AMK4_BERLS|nr:glycerophosphodiester phosphodiesterase family protein [Bernardetia litoralis]AFM05189.1 glycerophosphoryl diester phosphodiesterase [Bernardetia litoralis DSM 6794]